MENEAAKANATVGGIVTSAVLADRAARDAAAPVGDGPDYLTQFDAAGVEVVVCHKRGDARNMIDLFNATVGGIVQKAVLADRAAQDRDEPVPAPPPPPPIAWASRVAQAVLAELDDAVAIHTVARALAGMARAGSVDHFELVERLGREERGT
jgi:hypothetical protein